MALREELLSARLPGIVGTIRLSGVCMTQPTNVAIERLWKHVISFDCEEMTLLQLVVRRFLLEQWFSTWGRDPRGGRWPFY